MKKQLSNSGMGRGLTAKRSHSKLACGLDLIGLRLRALAFCKAVRGGAVPNGDAGGFRRAARAKEAHA